MSPSTPKVLLTRILEQFACSPVDEVEEAKPKKNGSVTTAGPFSVSLNSSSSSLCEPVFSKSNVPYHSLQQIPSGGNSTNSILRLTTSDMNKNNVAGTISLPRDALLAPSSDQNSCSGSCIPTANAASSNAKRTRTFSSSGASSCTRELLFPSLCLSPSPTVPTPVLTSTSTKSLLLELVNLGEDDDADELTRVAELLRRPLKTPLQPMLRTVAPASSLLPRKVPEVSTVDSMVEKSYIHKSLYTLFCNMIQHRMENWMTLLSRAIAFQNPENETMHKRVLAALQEVQESIQVDDSLQVQFQVLQSHNKDEHTPRDDQLHAAVEQELEHLAAEAITNMKTGTDVTGRALSNAPLKKRCLDEDGMQESKFEKEGENKDGQRDLSKKQITFNLLMEATAKVLAQIGPDLDQQQTVTFKAGGTVAGLFEVSTRDQTEGGLSVIGDCTDSNSQERLVLCGVDLKLNTEELVSSMEKQARFAARSAAESVLLSAAAEDELECDERSCSPGDEAQQENDDNEACNSRCKMEEVEDPKTPTQSLPVTPVKESAVGFMPSMTSPVPTSKPFHLARRVSPTSTPSSLGGFFLSSHSRSLSAPSSPPPALVSPMERKVERFSSPRGKLQYRRDDYVRSRGDIYPFRYKAKSKSSRGPYIPSLTDDSSSGSLVDVAGALTSLKNSSRSMQ